MTGFYSSLQAQIGASSPYSRFGIGSEFRMNNVRSLSMGGAAIGLRSNSNINIKNPASYTSFDSTSFLFEAGLGGSSLTMTSVKSIEKSSAGSVSHIIMGFPIFKWWKTSAGFIPETSLRYHVIDYFNHPEVGNIVYQFFGTGGLNKVFLGNGFRLGNNFSVGVNINYLFGTMKHFQRIILPDSANIISAEIKNEINVADLSYDFGIQYHKVISKGLRLGVGVIFNNQSSLNSQHEFLIQSFSPYGSINYLDTVSYQLDENASLEKPLGIGAGITLERDGKWLVTLDYEMKRWEDISYFQDDYPKANTHAIMFGGQYTPNRYYGLSYWQKMDYRLGFRYANTPLVFDNKQLNEFGITFGLGLPIKGMFLQGSKSKVNIGMELGQRGSLANDLVRETFVNFKLSVSIYEWWFMKRKFD